MGFGWIKRPPHRNPLNDYGDERAFWLQSDFYSEFMLLVVIIGPESRLT